MSNDLRPEDEIKFENLPKNPKRLFGMIYPYFLTIFLIGGMYWVYNMDWAFRDAIKAPKLMRDTVAEPIYMQKGDIVAGVDIKEASIAKPEYIDRGEKLYNSTCASCHGDKGHGDGMAAKALNPAPRHFNENEGWVNGRGLAGMWKTIEEGIPGTGMISYNYLPVQDRFDLIHYIHTLMTDVPATTAEELADLDATYKLSEDRVTPNQIPVASAFTALESEFKPVEEKATQLEASLKSDKNDPGAVIVANNTQNIKKVVLTLLKNNEWKVSQSQFLNEVKASINTNGFKTSTLRLNNSEVQLMYSYLLKTFSQL